MKPNSDGIQGVHQPLCDRQVHKSCHLLRSLMALIFMLICVASAVADNGAFYLSQVGSFEGPSGIAVDSDGNIYVADRGNQCIKKFTSNRELYLQWGSYGSGDGQFINPRGIALDSSGNVFVADEGNHRIQKFTSSGAFIQKWGSYGTGDGQFKNPNAVAVSGNYLYVADTINDRIQKFQIAPILIGANPIFKSKWGVTGTATTQFNHPRGIATDSAGNIYVADTDNNRIQKFDKNTNACLDQWGSYGSGNGQFNLPRGVAVDANGAVYVADAYNHRIQKFASTGLYIGKWGGYGTGDGQFFFPTFVAVGEGGVIVVSDTSNNRVQTFACDNSHYLLKWGGQGTGPGQFNFTSSVNGIAVDSKGYVYVTDHGNNRIQKFTSSGDFVWEVGKPGGTAGSGPGEFNHPVDIAVGNRDYVYVADSFNYRIQKFTSYGAYVTEWPSISLKPLLRIAIDSTDSVYTVSYNDAVYKYTSSGTGGHPVGLYYTDAQGNSLPVQEPLSVAVDLVSNNVNFYVVSGYTVPNKILRLNSLGVDQWQASANDIALDGTSCLYAVNYQSNLVQKFTSSGTLLAQWGGSGTVNGRFASPTGIATDKNGNVYVVDNQNNRVQRFSTVPSVLLTFP